MHKPICLCSLPWSLSLYLPSLHSSSPVSCVHLCLQMRLQWWICGRSMSACLTLWCISTGLNPLSITLHRASFSFTVPLSLSLPFLSLSLLLSLMRYHLASWISYGGCTNTQTQDHCQQQNNKHWAQNFQLIFPGGRSEVVHLTFWPNGGECRTGGATSVMQTLSQ